MICDHCTKKKTRKPAENRDLPQVLSGYVCCLKTWKTFSLSLRYVGRFSGNCINRSDKLHGISNILPLYKCGKKKKNLQELYNYAVEQPRNYISDFDEV